MGMVAIFVNGNLSKIGSAASEEKSFENVNGRTLGRTKSDHNSLSWV